jgi:hypothetical protein
LERERRERREKRRERERERERERDCTKTLLTDVEFEEALLQQRAMKLQADMERLKVNYL